MMESRRSPRDPSRAGRWRRLQCRYRCGRNPRNRIEVGLALTIDATNKFGDRPAGYDSIAQQVKAIIGGPTAKAFNTNFASLYDNVDAEPLPPGTLFASDPDGRETTERLIRDAGLRPDSPRRSRPGTTTRGPRRLDAGS
jgi:hypothetical protein